MTLKLDNSIPKDPYTKQLCSDTWVPKCTGGGEGGGGVADLGNFPKFYRFFWWLPLPGVVGRAPQDSRS